MRSTSSPSSSAQHEPATGARQTNNNPNPALSSGISLQGSSLNNTSYGSFQPINALSNIPSASPSTSSLLTFAPSNHRLLTPVLPMEGSSSETAPLLPNQTGFVDEVDDEDLQKWWTVPLAFIALALVVLLAVVWPIQLPDSALRDVIVAGSERRLLSYNNFLVRAIDVHAEYLDPLQLQPSNNTAVANLFVFVGTKPPLTHRFNISRDLSVNLDSTSWRDYSALRFVLHEGSAVQFHWSFSAGSANFFVIRKEYVFRLWSKKRWAPSEAFHTEIEDTVSGNFTLEGPPDIYYVIVQAHTYKAKSLNGTVKFDLSLVNYDPLDYDFHLEPSTLSVPHLPTSHAHHHCLVSLFGNSSYTLGRKGFQSDAPPSSACTFTLPDTDPPQTIYLLLIPPPAPSNMIGGTGKPLKRPFEVTDPFEQDWTVNQTTSSIDVLDWNWVQEELDSGTWDKSALIFHIRTLPRDTPPNGDNPGGGLPWVQWPSSMLHAMLALMGIMMGLTLVLAVMAVVCGIAISAHDWILGDRYSSYQNTDEGECGDEPLPVYVAENSSGSSSNSNSNPGLIPPPYSVEDPHKPASS